MAAKSEFDQWQCWKSLPECLGFMLENETACDVEFIVGEKKTEIKAHKTILMSRSPVFYAMLDGPLKETKAIRVPDIEEEIFKQVMSYMYTDVIKLTEESVFLVLYAAKKYCLDGLSKECVEFLESSMTEENVFILYEQSHLFDDQILAEKCLEKIKQNPKKYFESYSFLDLCHSCCEKIVSCDDLNVKEKVIYERVLKWSEAECTRQQLEISDVNKRKVLGSILYKIRFPVFENDYFARHILINDLLSAEEKVDVTKHFSGVASCSTCIFGNKKRRLIKKIVFDTRVIRYRSFYSGWCYQSGKPDRVNFSVSKDVVLHGVVLYGDWGMSEYCVNLDILDDRDDIISSIKTNYTSATFTDCMRNILLETPIHIDANKNYKVVALISGPDSAAGDEGSTSVTVNDITITFSKLGGDDNGTNEKRVSTSMLLDLDPYGSIYNISDGTVVKHKSNCYILRIAMASSLDLDQWQTGKSLPQCLGFIFENEIACDVTFIVGDVKKEIKAHKTILLSRSPVFYAMFNGPLKETNSINIPDIEDDVFKQVLWYIYTDNINLTEETAVPVLYAAKKYCLDCLSQQCVEFLEYALTEDNVFLLYEQAMLFGEKDLEVKCWGKIKGNSNCLQSPSFLEVSHGCCEIIISSDDLRVKEEIIYERLIEWSLAECTRQHLNVSDDNKRNVLGSILYKIRFPLMNKEYFARHLLDSNLLTPEEKEEVLVYDINTAQSPSCIFVSNKRTFFVKQFEHRVIRFRSVFKELWKYNSSALHKPDRINFSISNAAVLYGVMLYGDDNKSIYRVDLAILDDQDTVLSSIKTNYIATSPDNVHNILLDAPISIDANRHYKIVALISGPPSKAGDEGMKNVSVNDIKISFYRQNRDSNGTDVNAGQIPGLLLSF